MSAMQARRRGILNVSSGEWNPGRLGSGLQAWYDASDTGTVTHVNNIISQWDDKSVYQRHLTQTIEFRKPQYVADSLNGLHAVNFNGVSNWMATTDNFPVIGDPAFSVYTVYEKTNTNRGAVYGWGTVDVSRSAFGLFDNGTTLIGYVYVGNNNYLIQNVPVNQPVIEGYVKSPGAIDETSLAVRNGVPVGLEFGNSPSAPTIKARPLHLGRFADFGSLHLQGRIYELFVVSSAQGDLARQRSEGYLAHRWGLQAQLPIDHPFRDNPP